MLLKAEEAARPLLKLQGVHNESARTHAAPTTMSPAGKSHLARVRTPLHSLFLSDEAARTGPFDEERNQVVAYELKGKKDCI